MKFVVIDPGFLRLGIGCVVVRIFIIDPEDVAAFLGDSIRAIGNWMAAYRASGDQGLTGKPHPGAKPKLSARQERGVLSWLAKSPQAFGYKTNLWTTRRLAEVIEKPYAVRFNANYVAEWLTRRDHSPQKP